jgi:hypothetical protein
LIPEPEQDISMDQVNITKELTEALNQSSKVINIPEPNPTQEGKPRT